jgi:hypothetical protein
MPSNYRHIDKIVLGCIHVHLMSCRVADLHWVNHCTVYLFGLEVFHATWHVGASDQLHILDGPPGSSEFFVPTEFRLISDGDTSKCINLPIRRTLMFFGLYP